MYRSKKRACVCVAVWVAGGACVEERCTDQHTLNHGRHGSVEVCERKMAM